MGIDEVWRCDLKSPCVKLCESENNKHQCGINRRDKLNKKGNNMTNIVMDYLGKAEGLTIHKNDGELDITSPYGVYRYRHPKADIFDYIDQIALESGITNKSANYTQSDFYVLNTTLERVPQVVAEVRRLASKFYDEYFKNIYLELFPEEAQLAFLSMYTTSQEGAMQSTQAAINDIISMGIISSQKLIEDGAFGAKTKAALELVYKARQNTSGFFGLWFEEKILRHMTMYYDTLAIEDPAAFKKFYKGWRNRLEALADSK